MILLSIAVDALFRSWTSGAWLGTVSAYVLGAGRGGRQYLDSDLLGSGPCSAKIVNYLLLIRIENQSRNGCCIVIKIQLSLACKLLEMIAYYLFLIASCAQSLHWKSSTSEGRPLQVIWMCRIWNEFCLCCLKYWQWDSRVKKSSIEIC